MTEALSEEDKSDLRSCYKLIRAIFYYNSIFSTGTTPELLSSDEEIVGFFNNPAFTGFAELDATGAIRFVAYVKDVATNHVLSVCQCIKKPTVNTIEIWSVASNPYFMRSGAAKLLILNIIKAAHLSDDALVLEVARDSFPFITFYDRLLMYYKFGFNVISPTVVRCPTITGIIELNLTDLRVTETEEGVSFTYNGTEFSLEDLKLSLPLMYPAENTVIMKFVGSPFTIPRVDSIIPILGAKTPIPATLSPVPTVSLAAAFHSEYVLQPGMTNIFSTGEVPENIELVIINSPGFYTYASSILSIWPFIQKYTNHIPIEQLKQIFPGIRKDINGFIPTPNMNCDSGIAYMEAIDGNMLLRLQYLHNTIMQIHSYASGDVFPELELSAVIGVESEDWLAPIHGVYDVTSTPGNVATKWDTTFEYTEAQRLFATPLMLQNAKTYQGIIDPSKKLFPDQQFYLENQEAITTGTLPIRFPLTGMLNALSADHPDDRMRVYVLSCGATNRADADKRLNEQLRLVTNNYVGRIIDVDTKETLDTMLDLIGAGMVGTFGYNLSGGKRKSRRNTTFRKNRKGLAFIGRRAPIGGTRRNRRKNKRSRKNTGKKH